MNNFEIFYHIIVFFSGLLLFILKWTAKNDFIEIILKVIGKLFPMYMMLYSAMLLAKNFNLL